MLPLFVPDFTLPSDEEIFEQVLDSDKDPNQFNHWFSKIQPLADLVAIPKSAVCFLDQEMYFAFHNEQDEIDPALKPKFNQMMDDLRAEHGLNYPVFMKSGLFSNKFEFENCIVRNKNEFYDKFYNIHYNSLMLGVPYTRQVVIREFIHAPVTLKIYGNMPLHFEFRLFVDFDTQKVSGVIDYWHPSITDNLPPEQRTKFDQFKAEHKDFISEKMAELADNAQHWLDKVEGLSGCWSIDCLFNTKTNQFHLIDMALARQSWGWHFINDEYKNL